MKYILIKGAGTNAQTLNALLIQERDTLDRNYCEDRYFYNSGAPLSEEVLTSVYNYLVGLDTSVLVIGWNCVGYELRKLSSPSIKLSQVLKESLLDVFRILHIQYNQMISFYNIVSLESDKMYQVTPKNLDLQVLVKTIPYSLSEMSQSNYVKDFLLSYAEELNRLWITWYEGEYLKLTFTSKDLQSSMVELSTWSSVLEDHIYKQNALDVLPAHCVVEKFR